MADGCEFKAFMIDDLPDKTVGIMECAHPKFYCLSHGSRIESARRWGPIRCHHCIRLNAARFLWHHSRASALCKKCFDEYAGKDVKDFWVPATYPPRIASICPNDAFCAAGARCLLHDPTNRYREKHHAIRRLASISMDGYMSLARPVFGSDPNRRFIPDLALLGRDRLILVLLENNAFMPSGYLGLHPSTLQALSGPGKRKRDDQGKIIIRPAVFVYHVGTDFDLSEAQSDLLRISQLPAPSGQVKGLDHDRVWDMESFWQGELSLEKIQKRCLEIGNLPAMTWDQTKTKRRRTK